MPNGGILNGGMINGGVDTESETPDARSYHEILN